MFSPAQSFLLCHWFIYLKTISTFKPSSIIRIIKNVAYTLVCIIYVLSSELKYSQLFFPTIEIYIIFGSLISIISAYPFAHKKKPSLILSFYLLSHSKSTSSYTPVPINPIFKIKVLLSFSSIITHFSPSIPLISAPKGSAPITTFSQGVPITESNTTIAPLSSSVLINRPHPCFNLSPISG